MKFLKQVRFQLWNIILTIPEKVVLLFKCWVFYQLYSLSFAMMATMGVSALGEVLSGMSLSTPGDAISNSFSSDDYIYQLSMWIMTFIITGILIKFFKKTNAIKEDIEPIYVNILIVSLHFLMGLAVVARIYWINEGGIEQLGENALWMGFVFNICLGDIWLKSFETFITPFVCSGISYLITVIMLFMTDKKKAFQRMAMLVGVCFICSFSAIYYAYINTSVIQVKDEHQYEHGFSSTDLEPYKISQNNPNLPTLSEPSQLMLTKDRWLILDGAEAVYPTYSAIANTVYVGIASEDRKTIEKYVSFRNTITGFNGLVEGQSDVFFGAMPSDEQYKLAAKKGVELVVTPIAKEGFVFFVSPENTADTITVDQIKGIYSGKIKNWAEITGTNQKIIAFQRQKNSGSQTLLEHIMDGTKIALPPRTERGDSMGGIYTAVVEYQDGPGAIAYSFRYFIESMQHNKETKKVKLLAINGFEPTDINIRTGRYPFTTNLYAITLKSNQKPALAEFLNWLLSPQGQEIIEKSGYVRLN